MDEIFDGVSFPNDLKSKFIPALTKSLHTLCNAQDFNECIELAGYIHLKVDRKDKYDYVLDELISRQGKSPSTYRSNSYHSSHFSSEGLLVCIFVESTKKPKSLLNNSNYRLLQRLKNLIA